MDKKYLVLLGGAELLAAAMLGLTAVSPGVETFGQTLYEGGDSSRMRRMRSMPSMSRTEGSKVSQSSTVDPGGQVADARLTTGMTGDDAEQSKLDWVRQRLELDR